MEITAQWTYSGDGRKAIHEAGHVASALFLGIGTGDVTIVGDEEGGGYTEICDDWIQSRDPTRVKQRAVVAMAGIASDVLFGRNHCDPNCDTSWDEIYASEEGWRPDICKTCCLDWVVRNTGSLSGLSGSHATFDHLLAEISRLQEYKAPPRSDVGTHFQEATAILARQDVGRFVGQFAEELCVKHLLSKNESVRIWDASVMAGSGQG